MEGLMDRSQAGKDTQPLASMDLVMAILRESLTLKRRALAAKAIRILVSRDERLAGQVVQNGAFELLLPLLAPSFGEKPVQKQDNQISAPIVETKSIDAKKPKRRLSRRKRSPRSPRKSSTNKPEVAQVIPPLPDEGEEERRNSQATTSGVLSVLAESNEEAGQRVCDVIKTIFFLAGKHPDALDKIWRLGGAQMLIGILGKGFGGPTEMIAAKLISDIVEKKQKRQEYFARDLKGIEALVNCLKTDPEGGKLELGENILLTMCTVLDGCEEACKQAVMAKAEPVLANVFRRSVRTETSIAAMRALIPLLEYDSDSRVSFSSSTSSFALLAQMLPPPTNETATDSQGISSLSARFGPQIGVILSDKSVFSTTNQHKTGYSNVKMKVTGLIERLRLLVMQMLFVLSSFEEKQIWVAMKNEHIVGRLVSVCADHGISIQLRARGWEVLLSTMANDDCGNSLFEFGDNGGYGLIAQSLKNDFGRAEAMREAGVDVSCDLDSGMIANGSLRLLLKLLTMAEPSQFRTMWFELKKLGILVTLGQVLRSVMGSQAWYKARSLAALTIGLLSKENSSIADDVRKNGILKQICSLIAEKDPLLSISATISANNCIFGSENIDPSLNILGHTPLITTSLFNIISGRMKSEDASDIADSRVSILAALNLFYNVFVRFPGSVDSRRLDIGPCLADLVWNENEINSSFQLAAVKIIGNVCLGSDDDKKYAFQSGCAIAVIRGLCEAKDDEIRLHCMYVLKVMCRTTLTSLCDQLVDFGAVEIVDGVLGYVATKFNSDSVDDSVIALALPACDVLCRLVLGSKAGRKSALQSTVIENLRDIVKLGGKLSEEFTGKSELIKSTKLAVATILERPE